MSSTPSPYEFGAAENKEFLELAVKAKLAAVAILLLTILDLLTLFAEVKILSLAQVVIGIVTVLAGFYAVNSLLRTSNRLTKIANTEGNDMPLLFQGTQRLKDAFVAISIAVFAHIPYELLAITK